MTPTPKKTNEEIAKDYAIKVPSERGALLHLEDVIHLLNAKDAEIETLEGCVASCQATISANKRQWGEDVQDLQERVRELEGNRKVSDTELKVPMHKLAQAHELIEKMAEALKYIAENRLRSGCSMDESYGYDYEKQAKQVLDELGEK